MTVGTLQSSMPHFDWQAYLSQLPAGTKDQVTDVIVRQPDYLKAVDAAIESTPATTWKEYLTFGLISAFANDLSAPFAETEFEFSGKVIAGRQEMQPRWKRGITEVEQALGEPIGRLYIERHFKPEAKARMDALIRNLLAAFKVGIAELEWMSPETKVQAQAKLAKYPLKIAYPDQWRDFSALEIKPGDLVGNMLRFRQFQDAENWERLGKPVERWRWGFTPQTVNASYNSTSNEITFPAGILQPPFFDMDADDAINYGAIGAVIGHEISHGFDDQGRKSDGDGNLRDWWTADDAKKFEERATRLGAQYQSYTPLPGMKINGRQTMGENIGDLSGLAVAYRAYQMSLHGKPAPVIGGFTGDQRFFLGFGQIWRFKSRDEALRNQLLTDVHSPGMFRAFVPLTNIDAFYAAFNLKPGDKLYRRAGRAREDLVGNGVKGSKVQGFKGSRVQRFTGSKVQGFTGSQFRGSLTSQCVDRIQAGGAKCWGQGAEHSNQREESGDCGVDAWLGRLDTKYERLQHVRGGPGAGQSHQHSQQHAAQRGAQHRSQDARSRGAQGQAQTDVAHLPGDEELHGAVDADDTERDGEQSECRHHARVESPAGRQTLKVILGELGLSWLRLYRARVQSRHARRWQPAAGCDRLARRACHRRTADHEACPDRRGCNISSGTSDSGPATRTPRSTPTIVVGPRKVTTCPTGSRPGKNRLAATSLISMTSGAPALSAGSNRRP